MEQITYTASRELETLRDQVRETSERLQQAELDNEALRERLAVRHRELDELHERLASSSPSAQEAAELHHRLITAENAAAALARELDRVEAELEVTRNRFHMAMLTEALREFDNDSLEISNDEDELDHTIVIRNGYTFTLAPGGRK